MNWTTDELDREYHVVKQTRLGCLCGDRTPTLEQENIAHMEAHAHVKRLRSASAGLQQLIEFRDSL